MTHIGQKLGLGPDRRLGSLDLLAQPRVGLVKVADQGEIEHG